MSPTQCLAFHQSNIISILIRKDLPKWLSAHSHMESFSRFAVGLTNAHALFFPVGALLGH